MTSINGTVAETPTTTTAEDVAPSKVPPENKWPGWPGECVFRLIVPVLKVGSIIGRKGDIIKKMCEETKARIRVLDPPLASTPDRIVLITGKEEPELPFSPAMDAVIRVFKRINGFPETEGESLASVPFCSIRLLVPSVQALSLIGKQGSSIKAIQESTGCSVRVLSDEVSLSALSANSEERVVDMQGEAIKVLKALESVLGHLRKFLVDRSVLPLFEKPNTVTSATQEHQVETSWIDKPVMRGTSGLQSHLGLGGGGGDYSLPMRRETLFADREPLHGLSLYGRDPGAGLTTAISPVLARTGGPIVTQVAQTMQIPLIYAEDIIGVAGTNIAYIRRTSGAILTVQESRGLPDEITVEIKGTAAQVQTAQQLIQECVNGQKELSIASGYGKLDSGLRSSYSQLGNSSYPPPPSSSASAAAYGGPSPYGGGYGASGLGGYSSGYRM